jgi:hypothetical protein
MRANGQYVGENSRHLVTLILNYIQEGAFPRLKLCTCVHTHKNTRLLWMKNTALEKKLFFLLHMWLLGRGREGGSRHKTERALHISFCQSVVLFHFPEWNQQQMQRSNI